MWPITVSFRSTPPPDIQIDRVVATFQNVGIILLWSGEERGDNWVRWMSEEMVDTGVVWPGLMDNSDGAVTGYRILEI